jgi:hypothetical protein
MADVHERPEGANDADPSIPWKPSDPARLDQLGLEDPDPSGSLPKGARIADVLARALVAPGSADPVEGIVDGVRIELAALADALHVRESSIADTLVSLARRLWAAMQLLRWTDNRERMPLEEDEEEPPPSPSPAPAEPPVSSEDMEETRDAAPDEPPGDE